MMMMMMTMTTTTKTRTVMTLPLVDIQTRFHLHQVPVVTQFVAYLTVIGVDMKMDRGAAAYNVRT
jgi:hypothetical protein